jgi:hypothetical protein
MGKCSLRSFSLLFLYSYNLGGFKMKKSNLSSIKANKATLELGGIDYELRYDLNAFAEIEEEYGSINELLAKMESGSAKAIRAMVWAGLLCNEDAPSEKEVGNLINMNDMQKIADAIQRALVNALPENDGTEKN